MDFSFLSLFVSAIAVGGGLLVVFLGYAVLLAVLGD